MTLGRAFSAEFRKAVTLPSVWIGLAVAFAGSVGIAVLNAFTARGAIAEGHAEEMLASTSPFETAFIAAPLGTVGAVIVGVVLMSSEYAANSPDAGGGRQITTTFTAVPQRLAVLVAKSIVAVVLVVALALVMLPLSVAVASAVLGDVAHEDVSVGDMVLRCVGAALYWALTGLMALAITVLARSGIIPLIVLIANSSLVSVSLLLSNVTPLAHWLPDMAGRRLFGGIATVDGGLDVLPGALVMAAWTLGLLVVAQVALTRRDA